MSKRAGFVKFKRQAEDTEDHALQRQQRTRKSRADSSALRESRPKELDSSQVSQTARIGNRSSAKSSLGSGGSPQRLGKAANEAEYIPNQASNSRGIAKVKRVQQEKAGVRVKVGEIFYLENNEERDSSQSLQMTIGQTSRSNPRKKARSKSNVSIEEEQPPASVMNQGKNSNKPIGNESKGKSVRGRAVESIRTPSVGTTFNESGIKEPAQAGREDPLPEQKITEVKKNIKFKKGGTTTYGGKPLPSNITNPSSLLTEMVPEESVVEITSLKLQKELKVTKTKDESANQKHNTEMPRFAKQEEVGGNEERPEQVGRVKKSEKLAQTTEKVVMIGEPIEQERIGQKNRQSSQSAQKGHVRDENVFRPRIPASGANVERVSLAPQKSKRSTPRSSQLNGAQEMEASSNRESIFADDWRRRKEAAQASSLSVEEKNKEVHEVTMRPVSSMPIQADSVNDGHEIGDKWNKRARKSKLLYCSESSGSGNSKESNKPWEIGAQQQESSSSKQTLAQKWQAEKKGGIKNRKNQPFLSNLATSDLPKIVGNKKKSGRITKGQQQEEGFAVPPPVPASKRAKKQSSETVIVSSAPPSVEQITVATYEKQIGQFPTPPPMRQSKQKKPQGTGLQKNPTKPRGKNAMTAIKKPMQPHFEQPLDLKRKRPRKNSSSYDDYGDQERQLSEESSSFEEALRMKQAKKQKGRKFEHSDSDDLGEAPRKKQKQQTKKQSESNSEAEVFGLREDSLSEIDPPEKKGKGKKETKVPSKSVQKPKSEIIAKNSNTQNQPKPVVFNSLKERLAALQSELKQAERVPVGPALTRVEPVTALSGQMNLAQSRISQLINSAVSGPAGAKSIVSQLIENARIDKVAVAPPSCIPKNFAQPTIIDSQPYEISSAQVEDRRQEENVGRGMAGGREMIETRPPTESSNELQRLLPNYGRTAADLPSQFIVSRVLENQPQREQVPSTLSTSRLERIIEQRRANYSINMAQLPGLLPRPATPASVAGTQASANSANISRQVTFAAEPAPLASSKQDSDKPPEKKYAKLCEILTNSGYQVMIEENAKDVHAFYPDLLVAVSPRQREHYKRYGDVLHFQMFGQSYQHCRLGVFSVFNSYREPMLAGYAIIFSSGFTSYHRIIEFFLHIHGGEPQSILTSYQPELTDAINFLERQGIYNGAHVYSAKDIIAVLEKEIFGLLYFNDRLIKTEPFQRFITERSRERTTQYENKILQLCRSLHKGDVRPAVADIISLKQRICYSWLPNRFVGIGMNMSRQFYNSVNSCYRSHQSSNHETMVKELVQLDTSMKIDETKVTIYSDPVERVFKDQRLLPVRMALDSVVFKTFLKNYTEAFCFIVIEEFDDRTLKIGNFDTLDKRSNERLKVASWKCPCNDECKTGVACLHVLAGARLFEDLDYLSLVRKRWQSEFIQERIPSYCVQKMLGPDGRPLNAAQELTINIPSGTQADSKTTARKIDRGKVLDFNIVQVNSDEDTSFS